MIYPPLFGCLLCDPYVTFRMLHYKNNFACLFCRASGAHGCEVFLFQKKQNMCQDTLKNVSKILDEGF